MTWLILIVFAAVVTGCIVLCLWAIHKIEVPSM
jgi:hypothetical protein